MNALNARNCIGEPVTAGEDFSLGETKKTDGMRQLCQSCRMLLFLVLEHVSLPAMMAATQELRRLLSMKLQ